MNDKIKYIIIAVVSFFVGMFIYSSRKKKVDPTFNRTVAINQDGKYYLVFNSAVVLSTEITKEQYESFKAQYPLGAEDNLVSQYALPKDKYTYENGRYYEYKHTCVGYSEPMEITKEEYNFLKNKSIPDLNIVI